MSLGSPLSHGSSAGSPPIVSLPTSLPATVAAAGVGSALPNSLPPFSAAAATLPTSLPHIPRLLPDPTLLSNLALASRVSSQLPHLPSAFPTLPKVRAVCSLDWDRKLTSRVVLEPP